jgi:hypothetical protein
LNISSRKGEGGETTFPFSRKSDESELKSFVSKYVFHIDAFFALFVNELAGV